MKSLDHGLLETKIEGVFPSPPSWEFDLMTCFWLLVVDHRVFIEWKVERCGGSGMNSVQYLRASPRAKACPWPEPASQRHRDVQTEGGRKPSSVMFRWPRSLKEARLWILPGSLEQVPMEERGAAMMGILGFLRARLQHQACFLLSQWHEETRATRRGSSTGKRPHKSAWVP